MGMILPSEYRRGVVEGDERPDRLLALDEAVAKLAASDPQKAEW